MLFAVVFHESNKDCFDVLDKLYDVWLDFDSNF